jgi:hypothetical protein
MAASPAVERRVAALEPAVRELLARRPRPERLSGMHNPWGQAATLTSAWRFLDLCEDADVVDAVARLIGPDIVLWDSQLYLAAAAWLRFAAEGREGRYWPAVPLAGAVVLTAPLRPAQGAIAIEVAALAGADLSCVAADEPLYVVRYMPATSRFDRDPKSPANRAGMQEQPLINYAHRPLWLVRGADRTGNDFVTGFAPPVPRWAGSRREEH